MPAIRLRQLAATFFRIGNTTFGGGDPTIVALGKELVERRGAITAEQFSLSYMLSRVTPGTNVLAFCAAVGFQMRGWPGALLAVAAVGIPSAAVAVAVSGAFQSWMTNRLGAAAINATLAAAVGMMLAGAWLLIRPHVGRRALVRTPAILAMSLGLAWYADLSPLQVMGAAAVVGLLWREGPAQ